MSALADELQEFFERHVKPELRAGRRITLSPAEAAGTLGVSVDFFHEHIRPELRVIRRGRLVLVPVKELERWANEQAERVLP